MTVYTSDQPNKYLVAGFTKAALGARLLAKRRLEFVCCGLPMDSKKPVVQTIERTLRLDLSLPNWQNMFSHFSVLKQRKCCVFLISFFSRETPTSFASPRLDKIHNCLNFTKLPRDLRSCFAPRQKSRLEKSGHENVFENTKRRHYNPEIHCTLSDNWLLHQLYFNVLAGHIPSPQPTWHE